MSLTVVLHSLSRIEHSWACRSHTFASPLGPSLTGLSAPLPTRCPRSLYRLTMSGVSHLTPYRFVPSFTGFLFLLASHAQVAAVMNPRIVPLLSPLRLYISLLW